MSRDEFDDGFILCAFVGEREPIVRIAESLPEATVLDLGLRVCMLPLPVKVGEAGALDGHELEPPVVDDQDPQPRWPLGRIDASRARNWASLAGPGRVVLLEIWGYKDDGGEVGVGWQNGEMQPWYCTGSIDEIAEFLGVSIQHRDMVRRRILRVAEHLEHFVSAAAEGHQPFRRGTE